MGPAHDFLSGCGFERAGAAGAHGGRCPRDRVGVLARGAGPRVDRALPPRAQADAQERRNRGWAIAWRGAAACFLLWFISEQSRVLRIDFAREQDLSDLLPGWGYDYRARQQLFPACGIFAILGLLVGMGASFLFPKAVRPGGRPYWLFVILAGVAAVLIVSLPYWSSLIPYVVLIAIEMVHHAMRYRRIPEPSLSSRLLHAGVDTLVPAGLCLLLAIVLARDFEKLRRGRLKAASAGGRVFGALAVVGAACGGCFIAMVTIPAIHPCFAEGFRLVLGPAQSAMIVCGFALFGAGMAARAIAGPVQRQRSPWLDRLSALFRVAILGTILIALFNVLPDPGSLPAAVPDFVRSTISVIKDGVAAFWNRFPDSFAVTALGMLAVENLLWTSLILAIVCFVVELLFRDRSILTSPFDRIAESPHRVRTFLWLVVGFVVLCLSALPTLIVAGQAVVNLRMHAEDIATRGWPT